ncbi:ATP-dependent RNA helicase [Corynebacterium lowii]|uniref:RNA helicase n=1 Tax=Corynebacterium lowii TaxID=1544413 RepID=A0A0N8W0M7_9CORY|nr:ATP-dependent RNA helicase [Corynebacterium lowii]KQB87130.1 ATP-dependent RNA helicase HrpB [Corynebacterium lowii]MDP9852284.1 ATP-dependent helicase HrpB [Corynebacterium lowii]
MNRPFDLARIGQGLPFAAALPELEAACREHGRAVVQAPPGTGKTTLVPPALANWRNEHHTKVLVCAPRRVAVRSAAQRLASLDGSALGERVGHRMRGHSLRGSAVEFVTPGVLLRMVLADPSLDGIGAVVVDEVHERHLDTDVLLGMLIEVTQLREDLVLVAMSATVQAQRYADLMGGAPIVDSPAIIHPLAVSYSPHPGRLTGTPEFYEHLADLARRDVREHGESALVFVPGVREVERVVGHLGDLGVPLHGRLPTHKAEAALRATGKPRVIVATSIAESSLTVPGVRAVIDSGLSREPRRDTARQMNGLVTVSEARATAEQRAGRAGREGPGRVIRAFSEQEFAHLNPTITPEIAVSDLTQAALWLACWGTPRGEGLPLIDAPPAPALRAAEETLRGLGAVDEKGAITEEGRALAALPLDPRLGRTLLVLGPAAAETVAVLADSPSGDIAALQAPKREVDRLRSLAPAATNTRTASPGVVTALAYPNLVARREGEEYLLASGTRAHLPAALSSTLKGAPWLAVAEVSRAGNRAVIRAAARLNEAEALDAVGVTEEYRAEVHGGRVRGRLLRRAGAIELSATPVQVPADQATTALAATVRAEGLGIFTFSEAARHLYERLVFLRERIGEPWPDIAAADPEVWLLPELRQLATGTPVNKIDLSPALQRLLPWPEAARMEELAPERLPVPSGSKPRVDYSEGRPVVRVKLQECFGLAASPTCAGVPVQFRLLSPAGRDLAITEDLTSFWAGPYAQVRAEMRGRYPKHPWPEDPWSAPATAKTKKRM